MFAVFNCLVTQHDYRLVLAAGLVSVIACIATFKLYRRAVEDHGVVRMGWLLLTAVCAGSGIWATHFVAVLSYDAGVPVGYDLELTITSLMLAILFCGLGFGLSMRREGHICAVLGGAIVGAGIGIMHYTGMQALVVPGRITWDHALVTASIVLGCSLAAAAVVAYDAIRK
ncbi:MAG: MHYT domain-containing protein, partial [Hyphomicrobiaceae bacterium]